MQESNNDVFRLATVPNRNYRIEAKGSETGDGTASRLEVLLFPIIARVIPSYNFFLSFFSDNFASNDSEEPYSNNGSL